MEKQSQKTYTPDQALKKAEHYCAYQDRCHQEVRSKLIEWGVRGLHLENILSQLIEDNFLNEERFAKSYARGKFRIKKWGKIRIEMELKKRKISAYCIQQGLKEIDEEEYHKTLEAIIEKNITNKSSYAERNKLVQSLMRKGFEYDLIERYLP